MPLLVVSGLALALSAAAEGQAAEAETQLTLEQVEALLAQEPGQVEPGRDDADLLPPPLPPRHRGLVVEGSLGALGHMGEMRNVSPTAPWFRLQVGYEPLDWLMVFAEADVSLANTRYASRPPAPRTYALFGFGAGARATWSAFRSVSFYLQGDAGLASLSADVLSTYGYLESSELRPYFGGAVGIEWYQVSPHYALAIFGGVRDYAQTFERVGGERPPLVWLSGLALRYAL